MARIFPPLSYLTSDSVNRIKPTEVELEIVTYLASKLDDSYELFFRPFLNGLRPSMVLYRPASGVMLLDVYENIPGQNLMSPEQKFTAQKYEILNLVISPADRRMHEQSILRAISGASIFNKSTTEVRKRFASVKYYSCLSIEEFLDNQTLETLLRVTKLKYDTAFYIEHILQEIRRFLKPSLHTLELGKKFTPNAKQKELIQSKPGDQRIKGVAGSGKTTTLAHKAVDANKRHKAEVLILCFNITIRHYIKSKLENVLAEFIRSDFHITHYHDFFKHQSIQFFHKKPHIGDWEMEKYFEVVKDSLPKYDTIIIDEAQDYRRAWVVILKEYFLKEGGELAVFFDVDQDIYQRKATDSFPILGRPNEMNKSYRLSTNIANLCEQFYRTFMPSEDRVEILKEQTSFDFSEFKGGVNYHFFPSESTAEEWYEHIVTRISKTESSPDDIAIVGTSIKKLRELEYYFRIKKGEQTTRMFESKEEFTLIAKKHFSFLGTPNQLPTEKQLFDFKMAIKDARRPYKLYKFDLRTGTMKFSSLHSFKGWEIHTVFFLFDKGDDAEFEFMKHQQSSQDIDGESINSEIIYTGLTRARNSLNIVNIGNMKYHPFFEAEVR
jgi:superfamily I DNA/RNA helicase